MAIAYGVAMNKLNLHIPSTCPLDWRYLMEGETEAESKCLTSNFSLQTAGGLIVTSVQTFKQYSTVWMK